MGKRKYIITAAILAMFGIGFGVTQADSGNSLLQMNVKKSSVPDTVDVTFFTTAENGNSVVTRKNNNKYVVLLPNVSSTSSVAPSIGGIKDLVSNVEVKHVNDGIGGYTKVTFETTKPINIKTYMKKTSPLTQAQKDYKAILAQNNAEKPQSTASKPTEQKAITTQTKPQAAKPVATAPTKVAAQTKPTTSTTTKSEVKPTTKTQQKPALTIVDIPKAKMVQPVKAQVEKIVKPEPAKVQPQNKVKTEVQQDTYSPKMKYDEHGKRMIDLEPRVSHSLDNQNEPPKVQEQLPIEDLNNSNAKPAEEKKVANDVTAVETPTDNNSKSNFPYWILIAGGAVLTLGIIFLIIDAKIKASQKNKERLESFFNLSSKNQTKRRNKEYYDIANSTDLNWQEKYKSYKEKEEEKNPKKNKSEMSYVTDLAGLRKAIIPAEEKAPVQKPAAPAAKTFDQIRKEKLQAKISKMEHALSQTKEYHEVSNEVKSEDNAITKQMSDVKLKSFSKALSLKETSRALLGDDKTESRNKSYKEGRFIKLKNSPLSVTSRQNANRLGASDLISTGSKYLTNDGEMKMNKENENYLLSSLDEYLSILDTEEKAAGAVTKSLASIKSSTNPVMSRSGVTNPISRNTKAPSMNGLVVKSGYNIDSEKGFYLVNLDGVSALVGRVKDNVYVLKKFEYVVDKPLQVRQDDKNVYIVKAGKFKCLVDVSKEKMGTLIEI